MSMPLFAVEPDAHAPSPKAESLIAVARAITERLGRGSSIARQSLKSLMRQQFGGSDAWGEW